MDVSIIEFCLEYKQIGDAANYDDISYCNEVTFEFLKSAYSQIDFYGDFKKGDIVTYVTF